jgi:DNA-binding response OmpR family regulator
MIQVYDRHALVVHDEPAFTAGVTKMFQALGFTVDAAVDSGVALARLTARRADVVCVSLGLPRGSGYDLCESLRKDPWLARTRIIVVSDQSSPAIVAYAEEAGANAFLLRPFKLAALAECVASVLDPDERRSNAAPEPAPDLGGRLAAQ